jgi:hypothetical protein
MKGNFQVRFLEGGGLATARFHSAFTQMQGRRMEAAFTPHPFPGTVRSQCLPAPRLRLS